jgi:hypothetical protein
MRRKRDEDGGGKAERESEKVKQEARILSKTKPKSLSQGQKAVRSITT